jgi:2-polyprenyl-3-methyl-5-hydroxy-6-metoxy-1,4-benzoquinol methylase
MPFQSQKADIETSSENYARRFSGKIGEYFLDIQTRITLDQLQPYPNASILDVGGGHAQIAVPLVNAGFNVTIAGSDDICKERLARFLNKNSFNYITCNLLALPYENKSFDIVTCFRLLTHEDNWPVQISELCRVAKYSVIIDYPDIRSFNIFYKILFKMKKKFEGNTRTFRSFSRKELIGEFEKNGFKSPVFKAEFFLPMVIHRALKNVRLLGMLENFFYFIGLTKYFGSPVILRVERKKQ